MPRLVQRRWFCFMVPSESPPELPLGGTGEVFECHVSPSYGGVGDALGFHSTVTEVGL